MRPPAEGEDEALFVERAREAAALGPFGHHIHWTSPTHARPTGRRPGRRGAAARARWLREQGLEPRFFCGGGWYTDADVMAAVAELGYVDCTATAWRPSYLPPGAPRAALDQPAWVRLDDGRRVLELPTHALARRGRALARAARCRPSSTSTSTTTSCSTRKRRAALDASTLRAARAPAPAGRARRARRPSARSRGPTYAPADRARGARRGARAAAARASRRRSGISVDVDKSPFRLTVLRDGKTVVAEDEDARLRYQLASTRRAAHADEGHLVDSGGRLPGRDRRARPHGDRHGRADAAAACAIAVALHPDDRRAAGLRRVRRRAATSTSSAAASAASAVDLRGQILPIKVADAVLVRAGPVLRELGRLGPAARQPATSPALAFPGSPGGTRLPARRRSRACGFPPLADRAEVCVPGRAARRGALRRDDPAALAAYEARRRRPARAAAVGARADQVARRQMTGPAEVLDDVTRLQAAGIPLGWVLARQPVGDVHRHARRSTAARFPDPAGLIRQVHARGVRFMLWVSPKATCGAGLSAGRRARRARAAACSTSGSRRSSPSSRRGCAGSSRSASTASRATAATRSTSRASSPSLQNDYPLLFARPSLARCRAGRARSSAPATMGSQAVLPGLWAGDQPGDWIGLQRAIRRGADRRDERLPDLGLGRRRLPRRGPPLTAELFVRWAQLGAVSPVHGGRRRRARTRRRGCSARARCARSATRPSCTTSSSRTSTACFCGAASRCCARSPTATRTTRALLGAPTSSCSSGPTCSPRRSSARARRRASTCPTGAWVDLYTGDGRARRPVFTRSTPLDEFPLYARGGAVVPFNLRTRPTRGGA